MFVDRTTILGSLLAIFVILLVTMRILRRRSKKIEKPWPRAFELSDLNEMLADGKITQEEFDRLRGAMLEKAERDIKPRPTHGFEVLPPKDE